MKAVALTRYLPISDPESLIDVELPSPVATGRDLLVRVHAIAVKEGLHNLGASARCETVMS